jgi:hypothetical protein
VHTPLPRGGRLLLRAAVVIAVLLAPAAFPLASATFTGGTSTDASSVTAADLAPPTGLAVTQTCAAGPGIAFRARTTATGLDGVTVPLPAGTAADDLLLAQVAHRQDVRTISAPSGWTLLTHNTAINAGVTGSAATSAVYWKKAGAAEPASATFTLPAGADLPVAGIIASYSGVHRSSPINVFGVATGFGTTASTPSVTTTVADARVVHLLTKRQDLLPAPSGTTLRWSLSSAASGTAVVGATGADEVRAAAGLVGSRSSSAGTFSSEWVTQTVALRPALGAPSASLSWTASTSSGASGYQLERVVGGTVQAATTVTPVSTTSTSNGPLVDGTAYTFRLRTYYGTWTSTTASVALTPAC